MAIFYYKHNSGLVMGGSLLIFETFLELFLDMKKVAAIFQDGVCTTLIFLTVHPEFYDYFGFKR
jgi:hypothetical protein